MKINRINRLLSHNIAMLTTGLFMIFGILLLRPALAASEEIATDTHENEAVKKAVKKQADQSAIHGYDPVAYFTELKAVKGSDEFSYQWLGDRWLFSNETNRELFVGDTMAYMPNYGGYCSFDPVSSGHDHKVDPTVWRIVNDKLYLFYSEQTAGQKMHADEWQKVKAGLAQ